MNGKTSKVIRKYAKAMDIGRSGYRALKREHDRVDKDTKRMSLALMRETIREETA